MGTTSLGHVRLRMPMQPPCTHTLSMPPETLTPPAGDELQEGSIAGEPRLLVLAEVYAESGQLASLTRWKFLSTCMNGKCCS